MFQKGKKIDNLKEKENKNEKKEEEEEEESENSELDDIEKNKKKKCSLKEHNEIDAIIYCPECKIYLCNKCDIHHTALFKEHHNYNINEESKDIFTGICKEKKHYNKLKYYCINHNQLCCVECLCQIKEKGKGQHKNCEVYLITKLKKKKKNELANNIKYLEDLSKTLQQSIDQLKKIFEENNKNKEELKTEIKKFFTELRNNINTREDNLYIEIDKKYDELFFKEDFIKESEKLPIKINSILEKGKTVDNEWKDITKLNSLMNICTDIENSIKDINLINENINKCRTNARIKFIFNIEKDKYNHILECIQKLGEIKDNNKLLSKKEVEEIYYEFDREYNLDSLVDDKGKEEIKNKIVELGGDREKINDWICDDIL